MARCPAGVVVEVPGMYRVTSLKVFRQTEGVTFDEVPVGLVPRIDAIDRVIHAGGALSPGKVGEVDRPWYMHPHQEDNLVVLHGGREVELWTPAHGRIERFTVLPTGLLHHGEAVCDGAAMLSWPTGVFHRVISDPDLGSASINLAVHLTGFDLRNEFDIYDADLAAGTYRVIREGHEDQD